ncbi:unnamed protein product [Rotaria magnacalcarata]|uniref:CxC5 like cysteine cluster associated with KDZ domain-containing protein n=1 Tax=Rotaria magnacalcarata TaxID=392030 RepID=A0A8S2PXT2_9BILA|nr:unnamed protein product [Rotaria magnacalcarata]CAF4038144.1 unnamed protein product [Rotaria magnacalcarata]CAF4072084.1 unnamed protein product [Rotaria magnacalcarata]
MIHWFDKNLETNLPDRTSIMLDLLCQWDTKELKKWTTTLIQQSLMVINELGFLNQNEEKRLETQLNNYFTFKDQPRSIVEPFVDTCCNTAMKMIKGRTLLVFKMNGSCRMTLMNAYCYKCRRKYSNNYFIQNGEKYVTYESVFNRNLIYFGGDYAYEKELIRWLTNSILYLYSGFDNFSKCYNASCLNINKSHVTMCATRIRDLWFLYQFVAVSFFYTREDNLKIPIQCDRQELVVFMNKAFDRLNVKFVKFWVHHKEYSNCGPTCSKVFVCDGFQKPSRFICSNVKMSVYSEELGNVTIGCGNRPQYIETNEVNSEHYESRTVSANTTNKMNKNETLGQRSKLYYLFLFHLLNCKRGSFDPENNTFS